MGDNTSDLGSIKFKTGSDENESVFSEYIRTTKIQLNKLDSEHFEHREILKNYEEVTDKDTVLPVHPDNVKKVHEVFDEVSRDWNNMEGCYYGIVRKRSHEYIGEVSITNIDWQENTAEIDFRLPDKGELVCETCKSVSHFCFDVLGIEVVEIESRKSEPVKSEYVDKYIRSFGGEYEGIERKSSTDQGVVIMNRWSITSDEFYDEESDYSELLVEYEGE